MNNDILTRGETDENLVAQSLKGNRDAFGGIVRRYQSLVCALAYSSTGSVSQSEDLAQETFLTAWRQLNALREPAKLRPWLCRIARNITFDALKKERRGPHSEPLEAADSATTAELSPPEQAISREEEAILWRALAQIPEIYREPLVLFYREQMSVAAVAASLELTEDTVRQRLLRGRRILHAGVQQFVEGALARTIPGPAFAQGVLLALPGVSAGSTSLLGSITGKGAAAVMLKTLGASLVILGNYAGYRAGLALATSEAERTFIKRFYARLAYAIVGLSVIMAVLIWLGIQFGSTHLHLFSTLAVLFMAGSLATFAWLGFWSWRARRKYFLTQPIIPSRPVWEYQTSATFLGLPLVHIRIGGSDTKPVRAWIAAGNFAVGGLFAFGGMAIAPLSLGGCAIGLAPWGGMVLGVIGAGGLAVCGWAIGGMAFGWEATGGMALAWKAAFGGIAIAHGNAIGGIAHAADVSQAAATYLESSWFFHLAQSFLRYAFFLNILWVLPMVAWWRTAAKAQRNRSPLNAG